MGPTGRGRERGESESLAWLGGLDASYPYGRARANRDLPALDFTGLAASLQVRADMLALRGTGDRGVRHTEGPRACDLALAEVQSVESWRV